MAIKPGRWMAAAAAVFTLVNEPAQAGKVAKMSTPRVSCGGATQASTFLQVWRAPAARAPDSRSSG